jgi:hypothetical protein
MSLCPSKQNRELFCCFPHNSFEPSFDTKRERENEKRRYDDEIRRERERERERER